MCQHISHITLQTAHMYHLFESRRLRSDRIIQQGGQKRTWVRKQKKNSYCFPNLHLTCCSRVRISISPSTFFHLSDKNLCLPMKMAQWDFSGFLCGITVGMDWLHSELSKYCVACLFLSFSDYDVRTYWEY